MTSAEIHRFIERTLAETAAINAETALLGKETRLLLNDYIRESRLYVTESRERVRRLEANLDAWLRAPKNGKKE
jgi:hypothetical protein